jgi:hypothetical protein
LPTAVLKNLSLIIRKIKEDKETAIKLFEGQKVRVQWDENQEKWYCFIVDVVAILMASESQTTRNYWQVLKHHLSEKGNQSVTICNRLKFDTY